MARIIYYHDPKNYPEFMPGLPSFKHDAGPMISQQFKSLSHNTHDIQNLVNMIKIADDGCIEIMFKGTDHGIDNVSGFPRVYFGPYPSKPCFNKYGPFGIEISMDMFEESYMHFFGSKTYKFFVSNSIIISGKKSIKREDKTGVSEKTGVPDYCNLLEFDAKNEGTSMLRHKGGSTYEIVRMEGSNNEIEFMVEADEKSGDDQKCKIFKTKDPQNSDRRIMLNFDDHDTSSQEHNKFCVKQKYDPNFVCKDKTVDKSINEFVQAILNSRIPLLGLKSIIKEEDYKLILQKISNLVDIIDTKRSILYQNLMRDRILPEPQEFRVHGCKINCMDDISDLCSQLNI